MNDEALLSEFRIHLEKGFRISLSKKLGTYEVLAFFWAKNGERWRFLSVNHRMDQAWQEVKTQIARALHEGKMK